MNFIAVKRIGRRIKKEKKKKKKQNDKDEERCAVLFSSEWGGCSFIYKKLFRNSALNRALAVRPIGTSGSALVGVHPFRTRRNATPVFLLSRSQIVSRLSREQLPFYDYEPAFFRYFASRPDLASNFLRRSRFFSFFFFQIYQLVPVTQ